MSLGLVVSRLGLFCGRAFKGFDSNRDDHLDLATFTCLVKHSINGIYDACSGHLSSKNAPRSVNQSTARSYCTCIVYHRSYFKVARGIAWHGRALNVVRLLTILITLLRNRFSHLLGVSL